MILDNNFNYPNEHSNFTFENEEGRLVLNCQYWEFIIKSYWEIDPISDNDHVVFFQAYKSFIKTSLWEMNLQFGSPLDYEYFVDVMINSKDLSTSDWSVLLGLQNYETEILPNLLIKKETIDFSISNCN